MTDTSYAAKAGTSEWAITLFRHNGHDAYSKMMAVESVGDLAEAQATAASELALSRQAEMFLDDGGYWWARLEHGTWQPTTDTIGHEVINSATWIADGRQYVGAYDTTDHIVIWEEL